MPVHQLRSWRVRSYVFVLVLPPGTLMPSHHAAAAPAAQTSGAPTITILSINNARLLAGQRFDLRVEVGDDLAVNTDTITFRVTVNGQTVSDFSAKRSKHPMPRTPAPN